METIEFFKSALWCNRQIWQDINTKLASITDWNKIDELAELHGVIPQLLYAIKAQKQDALLPLHIAQKWNDEVARIAAENICKLTVIKEIVAMLNANNIPIVLLRGISSAWSRYPTPELRPMADIDILVPYEKLVEAVKLFNSYGYIPVKSGEWNFCHPNFNNVVIDLHINCFPWYSRKDMELLWENAKLSVFFSNEKIFVLPNEETLITEACHAVLCHGFPKPLWLEDIALLTHQEIDWERVLVIARNFGVTVPVKLFLEFAQDIAGLIVEHDPKLTFKENIQKNILIQLLPSFDKYPITNIGHLLSFIYLRGLRKKLQYIKERFFPENLFLARRYGDSKLLHNIAWKIGRPLLILWETALLFGRIIHHHCSKRRSPNRGGDNSRQRLISSTTSSRLT